jgi:anti-sigma regulatory factor (Ser/Thr protein kinase)
MVEPEMLHLPAHRGSVSQARHWVRRQTRALGVSNEAAAVVELLTSELVANAVLHGSTPASTPAAEASAPAITVTIAVEDGRCTLSVLDGSDEGPVVRDEGPEVPGGQGMRLVDRLADHWGSRRRPGGGKTVWFDVLVGDGAPCPTG